MKRTEIVTRGALRIRDMRRLPHRFGVEMDEGVQIGVRFGLRDQRPGIVGRGNITVPNCRGRLNRTEFKKIHC
jgi:hypothetical protein